MHNPCPHILLQTSDDSQGQLDCTLAHAAPNVLVQTAYRGRQEDLWVVLLLFC